MKRLLVHVCLLLVLDFASAARLRSNSNSRSSRKPPPAYPSYECVQGLRCERVTRPLQSCSQQRLPADSTSSNSQQQQQQQHHVHASLQACRLVCGKTAGLWPLPTGRLVLGSNYVAFHPRNLQFVVVNDQMSPEARDFVSVAVETFLDNVRAYCNVGGRNRECRFPRGPERSIRVHVKVESSAMRLDWQTNESYELEIDNKAGPDDLLSVLVTAQTVYGARHAFETLSQLVAARPATNCEDDDDDDSTSASSGAGSHHELVMLDEASVKDKPVFAHRGLLVDTGRNFLPLESLLRTVDALAANKMNVLHWHATDSQSFPLELKSVPLMSLWGAYDGDKIYTRRDMESVVSYARSRGVRVILEIDSPSHAGAGWQWGPNQGLGNLAVCVDQQPWRDYCIQPPCGQLNPVNPNTYSVLRSIYRELLDVFGRSGLAHLGGDELFVKCWNSTAEVVQGMARMGLGREPSDFLKIWSEVHQRQLEMLNEDVKDEEEEEEEDGSVILWSSQLTQPETIERYLDKRRFVVQTWVEAGKDLNERLLELGYRLVVSTKDAWYLDHGFWGVTKYHSWRDAYRNRIPQRAGVLGGEACMWGEYVNEGNLDARVWPRAAAVAERLWADPDKLGPSQATAEAEPRLQAQIARLKTRGVQSESLAPEWCNQHETQCY